MKEDTPAEENSVNDEDFLADVREKYKRGTDACGDNHEAWRDDVRFAKLLEQWPDDIKKQREDDGRPCLVIPRLQSFIRQVVNEARQNRPAINVVPADSGADVDTAEIMSGLIRNIEVTSDADVAYDTAADGAVSGGFGYIRVNTAYTSDDTFDQDIVIERVADPLTVIPDPDSTSVDGSDWNCAFVITSMSCDDFEAKYHKDEDEAVDWDDLGYTGLDSVWYDKENVTVAEYWLREDVESQIVALSDGTVIPMQEYKDHADILAEMQITQVGQPRTVKSKKVTQYILSGAEVLETIAWPGKYIPIVPVYGDEVICDGKRTFKSLIRDAKDAQREHNYWRSMAAETIALAPKVPFIGPKGAFDGDIQKWSTANDSSHAFITYDGQIPPQRQGFVGPSAGELQQAIAAIDDMKAIMGIYDASLGVRSNETSGVAIRQRQRQGDVATFHFLDNLSRSIRHVGRILLDLIPKVYSTARVIRVLGEDNEPTQAQIAPGGQQEQPMQQGEQEPGQAQEINRIYDITAGKYDLVVKAGPAFGTQREAAREEMVDIIRAFPASAPVLGPMYLRNSDWPGADDAAGKLEAMAHPQQAQGVPPEQMQQAVQQMHAMQQQVQQLSQENETLKQQWALKNRELDIKAQEADTKAHEAKIKELSVLMPPVHEARAQHAPGVPHAPIPHETAGNPFAFNGNPDNLAL
jgi:hypothetical protein